MTGENLAVMKKRTGIRYRCNGLSTKLCIGTSEFEGQVMDIGLEGVSLKVNDSFDTSPDR